MIWNDAGNVSERLKSLKEKGYDKVLSFNEPDYDQEANMSVDLASSYKIVSKERKTAHERNYKIP